MMLTTPAMASVPYWAAAPSCSTSIWSIAATGIPVVGHVGLTPQTATVLGGYRAQGRTAERAGEVAQLVGRRLRVPERLISADPAFWLQALIGPLLGPGAGIEDDVMADYIRCFRDPRTVAGSCADYRSAASIDLVHDEESFAAGARISCPVLALWGAHGFVGRAYDPLAVWQDYATDVRGQVLPTGHFLPEEAPGLVTAALRDFLD